MSEDERELIEFMKRREIRFREAADKDVLRSRVLEELQGGLWHTTHPDRFKRILERGAILPIPDPPNPDGWKTMSGDPYCTYAHKLGGVSLFDFHQFDPKSYAEKCPMSTWQAFVPYREKWDSSVWIEIDRSLVTSNFVAGSEALARQKEENAQRYALMPYIEAVHVGFLPRKAFKRAFQVGKDDHRFRELSCLIP
jgi:hypothetical protein